MKHLHSFAISERGVSQTNEDNYCAETIGRYQVFAVAGGRTGKPAGREAGSIAINALRRAMTALPGDPAEALGKAITDAEERIGALGRTDREHEGMGTDLSACIIDKNLDCTILDTGDGGVYYISRGSGIMIPREIPFVARSVRPVDRRMISHTLGEPYILRGDEINRVNLSDSFVVMSSAGLHDYLKKEEIGAIVTKNGENVETSCEALKDEALKAGSERTVTVVVLHGHPA